MKHKHSAGKVQFACIKTGGRLTYSYRCVLNGYRFTNYTFIVSDTFTSSFFFSKNVSFNEKSKPASKYVSFCLRSLIATYVEPVNTLAFVEPEKSYDL